MSKHTCPRRSETFAAGDTGKDNWTKRKGEGLGSGYLTCDFCGSLHPDTFMDLVEAGYIVGPTDKSYKAYVHKPVEEGQIEAQKDAWLAGPVGAVVVSTAGLDAALEHWDANMAAWPNTPMLAKFYFQHLGEDQMRDFVDLLNAKRIVFGYPGYFYTRPFFITATA